MFWLVHDRGKREGPSINRPVFLPSQLANPTFQWLGEHLPSTVCMSAEPYHNAGIRNVLLTSYAPMGTRGYLYSYSS